MWFMAVLEKTYFKELSLKYEFLKYTDIIHDEKGYISIGFDLPLEDSENIINDKENNMENNETKVTAKVMNETATEAITDTNNIIDNFNKDSDDMFEKEMPVSKEENSIRHSSLFAKAMCNTIASIEVVVNRSDDISVSDRIYTVTTDEQKLSMLTVLNKIFDYSFGKEYKKVFTVSYAQFINDFKEYIDFNNMYDATRIFRDFDETRDIITITVIEVVEEDKSDDNNVFEMKIPPLHAAFTQEATVDLNYVGSLRRKHNKFMLDNQKEECKILDKENELWGKYIKLDEEYYADESDMAYMNYLMELKPLSVDMYHNLSKKYDNLQKAYLALREYNNNLLEHIYAEEEQQD